jgi:hypothetical protein
MIILSQRNPKWSNIKLLPSFVTMGSFGCTTTCICMLSDYFKCFTIPNVAIDHNIKYTVEGMIKWESIDFPTFKWERRIRILDLWAIDQSLLNPDKAVILAIDHDSHWVVALRKLSRGWYWVADSWDGKKKLLSVNRISGSSHFSKK